MNEFFMFLTDNYIWILVVIALIIITIIGFLADKKKSNEKKEIKESKPLPMEVPTFIHNAIEENKGKEENALSSNDIKNETTEIKENNFQDSQNNAVHNNQLVMEQKNEQPIIPQSVNIQNNGLNSQNAMPMNNYNNPQSQNPININSYSYGIPTPPMINQQMNMQSATMQPQTINSMNNAMNNYSNQQQNNMNNYQNRVQMPQQPMMNQMNMQNNGMQIPGSQPVNNYNNRGQHYNNKATIPQPMVNNGMQNQQRVNVTPPQQINHQAMLQNQPVMNTSMNNRTQHQPIKVTPIAGMNGANSAVSFVNGPINNNQNQQ